MGTNGSADKYQPLRAALAGVAVATVSQFTPDGRSLLVDAIAAHVRFLSQAGVHLIVPCGNTGEYQSLSQAEWQTLVTESVGSAGPTLVLVGVGGPVFDAIDQARFAEANGATGVMVLPPSHAYQDASGVLNYYEAILDSVSVGVVLYVRNPMHAEVVLDIADHPRLVGVKFAIEDVAQFASLVESPRARSLVWTCGIAEAWAPFFMLAGASGFTSGIANLFPDVSLALHRAAALHDWDTALALRRACAPLERLRAQRQGASNVTVVKDALGALGRYGGPVRPPSAALSKAGEADLALALEVLQTARTG